MARGPATPLRYGARSWRFAPMPGQVQLHKLRSELDASSGVSYTALDRQVLISSGSWQDVGRTALSVYDTTLRKTLQKQVFPIYKDLQYWKSVKNSGFIGFSVCWLQNLPQFLLKQLDPHRFDIHKLRPANFTAYGWKSFFYAFKSLNSFFRAPVLKLADQNIQDLETKQAEATETVGKLLQCWKSEGQLDTTIPNGVEDMVKAMNAPVSNSHPTEPKAVLENLQQVLDMVNSQARHQSAIPAWYLRYWPGAVVGAFSAYLALKSWDQIVDWFVNSVVETAKSFLSNWVYDPLYQIYLTMRQDPTSRFALMGQECLDADIESLERMVVEFVHDHKGTDFSEDDIRHAVEQGDLGPVMRVYEKELETPIKSLVTGKLVRSLLIQLQKTKVDAGMALSGISQLIQSQQLVFGIIAALPALALVYLSSRGLIGYAYGTRDIKGVLQNQKATKDEIMIRLGHIEEVALENPTLDTRNIGEVYCVVAELGKYTKQLLSRDRYAQFCKDLDRLVSVTDGKEILDVLLRIYAKY